jgi:hypothetical protein
MVREKDDETDCASAIWLDARKGGEKVAISYSRQPNALQRAQIMENKTDKEENGGISK